MKGKGKGAERSSSSVEKVAAVEVKEERISIQFPDMTPIDHARLCPRYTAVLSRTTDDGIGIDEVDTLQTELETLLAAAAKRMRHLESEITNLNTWQDNKPIPLPVVPVIGKKERSSSGKGQPEGKRGGKGSDERPSKRFKDSTGKAAAPPSIIRPKGKAQTVKLEPSLPESSKVLELPKVQQQLIIKNDVPNRFWALVEPYCQEITPEDLKVLEDLMRGHEDDAEYHKVPSLGKHYAQKWAAEDLLEEQKEGTKPNEIRRRSSSHASSNGGSDSASSLLKKATASDDRNSSDFSLEGGSDDESSQFGPLTQRLVSALIEENIMTPLDDGSIEADAAEAATMSPRSLAKQFNITNTAQLERRIKRELEEQGILDLMDIPEHNPEDEVLSELRKKQSELRVLSQHNQLMTKRLYKHAKEELIRQDLRRKMAAADADVMDAYRKIQAAHQKKRTPTKKEKDNALRVLKERENIIKSLEAMG